MNYKVCILAAGSGTRMGSLSDSINKAILPVNFKAVISHIIEKFQKNIEIVIAVGHKKETVIDYLAVAHPDRKFIFVVVDKYVGPGTGPGYSLLQCKEKLQCPFIFFASDTMVLEDIPEPDKNWFGIAPVKNTEPYCTVKIQNNLICQLEDKTKNDNKFAFIGLAGVKDHDVFFDALEKNKDITSGEIQVSNGFKKLIEHTLSPVGFTWFDTGTLENYLATDKNFSGDKKFDFSKGSGNEFLYFIEDRVIKFFADETITKNRCTRAQMYLKGLCPNIEKQQGKFYCYKKIDGQTLYDTLNQQTVVNFLTWAKSKLWIQKELTGKEAEEFIQACKRFYIDKTSLRLQDFYRKTGIEDNAVYINGILVPPLKEVMEKVDWEHITNGTPSNFHGDLQFDNILVTKEATSNVEKFTLLDWRQDFSGLVSYGDLYYDFAKIYGGTLISYQLIKEGLFSFDMSNAHAYYNYHIKNDLVEAREAYESFLQNNNFDVKKIKVITVLIFLNMAPLHHDPFDLILYFMGRKMLYQLIY